VIKITKRHHAAALKFANEVRAKMGKRPVTRLKKGIRAEGTCCPIANTIGGDVFINCDRPNRGERVEVSTADETRTITHRKNRAVQALIIAFDNGDIPELELEVTP